MKNKFFTMLFVSASMLFAISSKAQVSINVSIGSQPEWAPVGYDNTPYYYIPDMDVYYDVPAHKFIYLSNNHWIHATALPAAYGRYDLYHVHKVPINQKRAYLNHDRDRKQYASFRGKFDQQSIRDNHRQVNNNNRNDQRNNKPNNNGHSNIKDDHHDDRHNGSRR